MQKRDNYALRGLGFVVGRELLCLVLVVFMFLGYSFMSFPYSSGSMCFLLGEIGAKIEEYRL